MKLRLKESDAAIIVNEDFLTTTQDCVFKVLKAVVTCAALRGLEPPLGEEEPPLGDTWPLVTGAAGGFFEFFFKDVSVAGAAIPGLGHLL